MIFFDYLYLAVLIFYVLLVAVSVYTVLFERRDPNRAFTWIVVIIVIPVVGLIFYLFFGQSYRKRKIFNLKELRNLRQIELLSSWQSNNIDSFNQVEVKEHLDIVKLLLYNSKTPLTIYNNIEILNNGSQTFPAIFEAISAATHHIHIEYYIIEADKLGWQLADLLCQKAAAGVEVRVLYDDVGCWSLSRRYIRKLKKSGVEVASFIPVFFPWLTSKANYRNHRKIVVVDGKVGFVGGLNFADRYLEGVKWGAWRDTHLRVQGEATRMLQVTFITDWYASTNKRINKTTNYFPVSEKIEKVIPCQMVLSGPDSDYAAIMQAFFATIARAKRYIYISTPYFLPNEALLTALKVAAMSGVDVRIMLPNRSDAKMAHWASRSYFTEMLEAKVNIYLYHKGFNHSKLMIVDGNFGSIGSANMDTRSFEDNFEITAMIYDTRIAAEMELTFLKDLQYAKHLSLKSWEGRKQKDNFKEAAARLFSPLL